jgi:hypothetical protein
MPKVKEAVTECQTCNWLQRLEAERFSIAYRKPEVSEQTKIVYVERKAKVTKADPKAIEARDSLMFNAGRFMAGDRDAAATKANAELEELLEAEA